MRSPFDRRGLSPFAQNTTQSGGGVGGSSHSLQDYIAYLQTLPLVVGFYSSTALETITVGGPVHPLRIENLIPGGRPVVAVGNGPTYDPAHAPIGGLPAFVNLSNTGLQTWDDDAGTTFDAPLYHLFVVMQYRAGTEAPATGHTTLISSVNDGTTRLQILSGGSAIRNGGQVRVNGGEPTSEILPLPLSVLEFRAGDRGLASPFPVNEFGSGFSNRGWRGPICALVACAAPLTDEQVQGVRSGLAAEFSI